MSILIKNGRVIDPKNNIDADLDILIVDGKISELNKNLDPKKATQIIDASKKIVMPGIIDLQLNLREPGNQYKSTLESEMKAANAGGITGMVCPPDTTPILDEPGLVKMLKNKSEALKLGNVYPLGALTQELNGKLLTEINDLYESGCIGFSQAEKPIQDTEVLYRSFQYLSTFNLKAFLRAEDAYLSEKGIINAGEISTRLGLKGIQSISETTAINKILEIAGLTKTKVHLNKISTAEGLNLIKIAKKNGVNVTCDVSIHQIFLTDNDIGFFNTNCFLKPPLRKESDRVKIIESIIDGTIDAICSDHSPVNEDNKLKPFAESEYGASSAELLMPLIFKLSDEYKIDLSLLVNKITYQPSNILEINKGNLSINSEADICIFDPEHPWEINSKTLISEGKNTPFFNQNLTGKVSSTIFNGNIVFIGH
ncbi:dihydroorotase [Candidatus Methylopumilus rimovensis]|jgi:dihydroorotase|uniref:dihydroorotase n=1 Tax=Candidatus Methylopumilus rimovensis TaxID=2588535 RepID=UPI00111E87EB|nr:dihydroorotase [Candidatus Methylopumilus rimovensis]QDD12462.1 dihydroorotase [Candidatus Methylopumilus rimovensis]